MSLPLKIIPFVVLLLAGASTSAQVVINEVCSKNNVVWLDEDSDSPDWIELYNAGASTVDLEDYTLSDADDLSSGWTFPDIDLAAGQYLIVFASGKDRDGPFYHTDFKISRKGETISLLDENDVLVDQIAPGWLGLDHSYGRTTGGLGYFDVPTPDAANTTTAYDGYAATPAPTAEPGHFPHAITIQLQSTDPGATIRYTTDGSEPNENSTLYTSSLTISHTAALRYRSWSANHLPSPVQVGTWFINEDFSLPVVSLCVDPLEFFHPDTGLYMLGPNAQPTHPFWGANFWLDDQLPFFFEYFSPEGQRLIAMPADGRMHGGKSARTAPQKPVRLLAKGKYGESEFNFPLFPDKDNTWYKRIVLRNSGGDYNRLHFRDAMLHQLMIENNLDIDLIAARPVRVYINGDYWGVQHLREKVDRYYLASNHGVHPDSLDLLEEKETIIEGDYVDFNQMHDFITQNNMADPNNFTQAATMIDVNSLTDYYVSQTYLDNTDWPYNNIKYWKGNEPGSKWRYIMFDLDGSLNLTPWATHETDALGRIFSTYGDTSQHVNILESLLTNPDYHNYFINRYADLMNTTFHTRTMRDKMDEMVAIMEPEMEDHFNRWGRSVELWEEEMAEKVIPFIELRLPLAREYVRTNFGLSHEVQLRIQTYPPDAGQIHLNTLSPELPWEGVYFHGNAVHLKAEANPGYTFSHWETINSFSTQQTGDSLTWDFATDDVITAYFDGETEEPTVTAFPNPFTTDITLQFALPAKGSVTVTMYDLTGRQLNQWNGPVMGGGLNRLRLPMTNLPTGFYLLHVDGGTWQDTVKIVRD